MSERTEAALLALTRASKMGERDFPMREVALELAHAGWPVFPCGQDKSPLVSGGFKSRTADVAQVHSWWDLHPEAMPGIVPGDMGLAALDVDSTGAAEAVERAGLWPGEFVVETGGTSPQFSFKGASHPAMHFYIRTDGTPEVHGVVVRHLGGYVIAPGARRAGRIYHVVASNEPQRWEGATVQKSSPHVPPPSDAPDPERVRKALMSIPNTADTTRDEYVGIAHMVWGALRDEGRDLFLEWAARWPGKVDPGEDARVYDTIRAAKSGWRELWGMAATHGFDATVEIVASAQADFDDDITGPPQEVKPKLSRREALVQMLERVQDAEDGIDRALALAALRKEGFNAQEIRMMLGELIPKQDDRPMTLEELLAQPELWKLPEASVPFMVWPGLKTLLSSREKNGKTTLVTAALTAVTNGLEFLGIPTKQKSVLWLTEESKAVVVNRVVAMGMNPKLFTVVTMGVNAHGQLKAALREKSYNIVVIDTLFRFSGIEDENDAAGWIPSILQFEMVTKTGAGLLVLAHANRDKDEYRGSTAIGGFVDALLEMDKAKPGSRLRKIRGKGRLDFGKPFCVELLEDNLHFRLVEEETPEQKEAHKVENDARVIQQSLEAAPGQTGTALAKATGLSKDRVRAALTSLQEAGLITHEGGKWHLDTDLEPEDA